MQYFHRDHLSTFCSTGARQYDEILTITFLSTNEIQALNFQSCHQLIEVQMVEISLFHRTLVRLCQGRYLNGLSSKNVFMTSIFSYSLTLTLYIFEKFSTVFYNLFSILQVRVANSIHTMGNLNENTVSEVILTTIIFIHMTI